MQEDKQVNQDDTIKLKLRRVIFGTDTRLGRYFDISLIVCIILSVTLVFLDTIAAVHSQYGDIIGIFEWCFTIIFTIEYLLRLYCSASLFNMSEVSMVWLTSCLSYLVILHYFSLVRISL